MRWIAVVLIALLVGAASGVAGGYAYTRAHDNDSSGSGPDVYCYDPNGPVHLTGETQHQVCVPTGR